MSKYISAWIDERASDTADINVLIRDAIQDDADCVIIYLSREAMQPEWVRREWEWAREREKLHLSNYVITCFI